MIIMITAESGCLRRFRTPFPVFPTGPPRHACRRLGQLGLGGVLKSISCVVPLNSRTASGTMPGAPPQQGFLAVRPLHGLERLDFGDISASPHGPVSSIGLGALTHFSRGDLSLMFDGFRSRRSKEVDIIALVDLSKASRPGLAAEQLWRVGRGLFGESGLRRGPGDSSRVIGESMSRRARANATS